MLGYSGVTLRPTKRKSWSTKGFHNKRKSSDFQEFYSSRTGRNTTHNVNLIYSHLTNVKIEEHQTTL